MSEIIWTVSDFVAVFNQTLTYAYPTVTMRGELANFRVSRNKWVYFDLQDDEASVKFFGTVFQLSGPLEDGLMLQVTGQPRLHPSYGFSITIQTIQPVGEGSLKRAAALLEAKLTTEGLFDASRKRPLPYPPTRIGLVTSQESAAYRDFTKILTERWGGIEVVLADVQVQGEAAPRQLVRALEYFNTHDKPVEVIVVTRGGGSADDLAAFNTESVTRAVAGSRIPTLVAIGHERDLSLAELAADQRASTPSNAAQLLVPQREFAQGQLMEARKHLGTHLTKLLEAKRAEVSLREQALSRAVNEHLQEVRQTLELRRQVAQALNPAATLERGYVLLRKNGHVIRSGRQLRKGDTIDLQLQDATLQAHVTQVTVQ